MDQPIPAPDGRVYAVGRVQRGRLTGWVGSCSCGFTTRLRRRKLRAATEILAHRDRGDHLPTPERTG